MTRTAAREVAVNLIFAAAASPELTPEELLDNFFDPEHYKTLSGESERFTEYPNEKQMQYIRAMVAGVCTHREELNEYIRKYARGLKLERISRVAAALLRCAIYEMLYLEDVPPAAAINEAVELAKCYDEPETVSFINGVLGSFARTELAMEAVAAEEAPIEAAPAEAAEAEAEAEGAAAE